MMISFSTADQLFQSCSEQCFLIAPYSSVSDKNIVWQGQRQTFEYSYKVQQVEVKQICCIPVGAGCLEHVGRSCCHTQDQNVAHYCGHPCPICE